MNLLHFKPQSKKQKLQGKYLLSGIRYIVTPLKRDRIILEAHNKNSKCLFGGCRVERSIGFIRRHNMIKL